MHEKCPSSELFWSVFFRIWYFPNSVRMRENTDQNNSECEHFLRSVSQVNVNVILFKMSIGMAVTHHFLRL